MIIAVDTGGTKTLLGVFNAQGRLQQTHKFPTPHDSQTYVRELTAAIKALADSSPIHVIIVALPGRVHKSILLDSPNLGWADFDVVTPLKNVFTDATILVENDANLAGLAETRALPKSPVVSLYITVSTGIGTGVIKYGQIDPAHAMSEGGHIVLEYNGAMAQWQSFASGKAIYERYGKYGKDITSSRVWHDIAKNLARGIVALAPVLQPEIVIIGGSMGAHFDKYGEYLNNYIAEYLHEKDIPVVVKAKHPEEAVVYGCYYFAVDNNAI